MNFRGSPILWKCERTFWIVFTVAFIGTGLTAMLKKQTVVKSAGSSPYSSTDAMLEQALGVSQASEPIAALLSHLPSKRPLVLIANRRESDSTLTALTVSYLAWPKVFFISYIEPEQIAAAMEPLHQLSLGGVFIYAVTPPKLPGSRSLGSKLVFAPLDQKP